MTAEIAGGLNSVLKPLGIVAVIKALQSPDKDSSPRPEAESARLTVPLPDPIKKIEHR